MILWVCFSWESDFIWEVVGGPITTWVNLGQNSDHISSPLRAANGSCYIQQQEVTFTEQGNYWKFYTWFHSPHNHLRTRRTVVQSAVVQWWNDTREWLAQGHAINMTANGSGWWNTASPTPKLRINMKIGAACPLRVTHLQKRYLALEGFSRGLENITSQSC